MAPNIIVALIGIVPSVLWVVLAGVLTVTFYRPIKWQLLPRLKGIDIFGIAATFVEEEMEQAIVGRRVSVSEGERAAAIRRLRRAAPVTQGAVVLWVDSAPAETVHERALLRHAGISIELCRSAEDAAAFASAGGHDAVIVRLPEGKPAVATEGLATEGLAMARGCGKDRYLILYAPADAGVGTPPGAFASTARPDQLVHYLVDVLERTRC